MRSGPENRRIIIQDCNHGYKIISVYHRLPVTAHWAIQYGESPKYDDTDFECYFSKVRSVKNIKISLNILKLHLSCVDVIYQITMHK